MDAVLGYLYVELLISNEIRWVHKEIVGNYAAYIINNDISKCSYFDWIYELTDDLSSNLLNLLPKEQIFGVKMLT